MTASIAVLHTTLLSVWWKLDFFTFILDSQLLASIWFKYKYRKQRQWSGALRVPFFMMRASFYCDQRRIAVAIHMYSYYNAVCLIRLLIWIICSPLQLYHYVYWDAFRRTGVAKQISASSLLQLKWTLVLESRALAPLWQRIIPQSLNVSQFDWPSVFMLMMC